MSDHSFDTYSDFAKIYRERVNHLLSQRLRSMENQSRLGEALYYAVMNGGKRLRPILVYAGCHAVGGNSFLADMPAQAIELIHCYSLVHDDLPMMDNDDLRRGKPTLHRAFDGGTAILAGDALQTLAFTTLSSHDQTELSADSRLRMIRSLSQAAGFDGMAGGQAIDLGASGQALDADQLIHMHELKTGALIRSAVEMGALCNTHIGESTLEQLDQYARCLGLAFQIHDDVLDAVGDTDRLGKPQGSDEASNKPTFVTSLGVEGAQARARELAEQAVGYLEGLGDNADALRGLVQFAVTRDH
jgi:geranylgeranyl pyrophosphate synthase